MALQLDITKSSIYQEGLAEGLAEGKAEGLAEGLAEGKAEGADLKLLEIVREMYAEGDIPLAKIARICHLTEERVKEILNL
jgi:predicted transposase YdaD